MTERFVTKGPPDPEATRRARHQRAPFYESLLQFAERRQAPFYSPGHKGGRTFPPGFAETLARIDLNNLPDTDTLHCPIGPIVEAEKLLADAYGAQKSFLLVGGSTVGNIAAMMTCVGPGERVLTQRNAHKSTVAGLVHTGALPVWLRPTWDPEFGISHGLDVAQVEAAFETYPDAKAMFVLNPTYFGTAPDIRALAAVAARRKKLLIVDQAHGAHFHFHPDLPTAAEDVGADAVTQSIHKTISGLSQAAVLHIRTEHINEVRVRKSLQLIETTSPNFAILSSIDLARRQMVLEGYELLDAALGRARRAREILSRMPGLLVLGKEHLRGPGSGLFALDETKIVLDVAGLGITGFMAQRELNASFGVQPELAGDRHLLFISTIGNTDEDFDRLIAAVKSLARGGRTEARTTDAHFGEAPTPEVRLSPREAYYARSTTIPFEQAAGRIAAEVVTPYPPGIPALMPGELISHELLEHLAHVKASRCPVSAADPTLATLQAVA